MWTWLRRTFWLALLCGAGYAAYTAWQRKYEPRPDGPPEWPPLSETNRTVTTPAADGPPEGGWSTSRTEPTGSAAATEPAGSATGSDGDRRAWVEPVGGTCPDGYPIKANANSGIFHVPGGRFYDRTIPERCYADEASAESDGYRRAKA